MFLSNGPRGVTWHNLPRYSRLPEALSSPRQKSKCISFSSVFRARRVLESELRCHVRKFIVEVPHTRAIRHKTLEGGELKLART